MNLYCRECFAPLGEWDGGLRLTLSPTCDHPNPEREVVYFSEVYSQPFSMSMRDTLQAVSIWVELMDERIQTYRESIDNIHKWAEYTDGSILPRMHEMRQRMGEDAIRTCKEHIAAAIALRERLLEAIS